MKPFAAVMLVLPTRLSPRTHTLAPATTSPASVPAPVTMTYTILDPAYDVARLETIREVIAFPKTQSATDLMTGAPAEVDTEALEQVHVQIRRRRAPQIASGSGESVP